MTETILPPDRLKHCLAAIVEGTAAGATPSIDRAELESLFASALVGPAACREYLDALVAATAGRTSEPEPPLAEFPLANMLRDGLRVLSDEQLFLLARSPTAIVGLNHAVDDALETNEAGVFWTDAEDIPDERIPKEYFVATERAVAAFHQMEKRTRPVASPRPKRWLYAALPVAVAASVMLAFFLGTRWSGNGRGGDVRLAAVSVRGDVTRGIEDVSLDVRNATNRRVFLTLVGTVPGRPSPGFFYRSQDKFLDLAAGANATLSNLPPADLGGSTVLLLVTSEVPAGEVVRSVTPAKLSPETAEAAAEQIRAGLREFGIRSEVRVVPLPAAKK